MPGQIPNISEQSMFILAYITDFFFQAKVSETAKQVAVPLKLVTTPSRFTRQLRDKPPLIIVDLAADGTDTTGLIREAKERSPDSRIVAFGAHVDRDLLWKASEAGAQVTPRSQFSSQLPELMASI
jgi:DNA-binding NarL/FixJ family response regulator